MISHPNRSKKNPKRRAVSGVAVASAPRAKAKPKARPRSAHDHDYDVLLKSVTQAFAWVANSGFPLFCTDAADLNDVYLGHLLAERQIHDCSACRRFIEHFGGLVYISADGQQTPAMWRPDTVPEFYQPAFRALQHRVAKAKVTGVFLTKESTWGLPVTGEYRHMAVQPPAHLVYRERALTVGQKMAAVRENVLTVETALGEFKPAALDQALRLFEGDHLARSEKFVAPLRWLRKLHDRPFGRQGDNILWLSVATAPEGYCHPKASVLGPLLDDIKAGVDFDVIKRRHAEKLNPLQYQRPQAAPKAGNIAAAEALVEKLGLAPSLERRFARVDELRTIWQPVATIERAAARGGVFGHLKAKGEPAVPPVDVPSVTMTWAKFADKVLSKAKRLQINVPSHGAFIGMLTAVHPEAPPILKWDTETDRYPVSWYCYNGGSDARRWGLDVGWADVQVVTRFPNEVVARPMPFVSEGAILIIEGAHDRNLDNVCLFPEVLKDELHGIRSTIEAHSKSGQIAGSEESACGFDLRKNNATCTLRAFVDGAWSGYRIDRWD